MDTNGYFEHNHKKVWSDNNIKQINFQNKITKYFKVNNDNILDIWIIITLNLAFFFLLIEKLENLRWYMLLMFKITIRHCWKSVSWNRFSNGSIMKGWERKILLNKLYQEKWMFKGKIAFNINLHPYLTQCIKIKSTI